jgi:WD40 repeat protein
MSVVSILNLAPTVGHNGAEIHPEQRDLQILILAKTEIWKGLRVGYYHDLPCRAVSFSTDGSLVAVSFDSIVTTWVPDSCQLKCSLGHPIFKQQITQVEFGTSNQCHLLVAASDERLSVWNLLTLTMMWTVPVHVSLLMADPVTANMAIITKENASKCVCAVLNGVFMIFFSFRVRSKII